jgi:hypothetical protein
VNESCRSEVDDLLTKYKQLEQNSTDLRTNLKTIQNKYNEQHAEMVDLKSKAYLLEHKHAALDSLYLCVRRINFASFCYFDVPTVWNFFIFHFTNLYLFSQTTQL